MISLGDSYTWDTGREYGPIDDAGRMGQLITITCVEVGKRLQPEGDRVDTCTLLFDDQTRMIKGEVEVGFVVDIREDSLNAPWVQECVLRLYDRGQYEQR